MADLSVVYRIAADISGLQDGVNRAAASTERLEGTVSSVGKALLGAFSATAVLSGIQRMIAGAIDYADALSNLNARTGVSLQGLQKIESIGVTAGVSMETLARSVTMLQKNLDSPAAQTALRNMGLSYEHIQSLSPETQFIEIAKSLAKLDDPIKRANAGTALFGRTWDQVAGAFEQDVDEIIANTRRMTDEQIEALDKAGDRWDLFVLDSGRAIKSWLGELVIAGDQAETIIQSAFAPSKWTAAQASFLNLPKLPGAPDNTGLGLVAPDPNIAKVIRENEAEIEAAIRKRQRASAEAAETAKKAEKEISESLERMRYGYFLLAQSAVVASQNVAGFGIRTSEVLTISNDFSEQLNDSQIKTDAFGHAISVNLVPSLQGLGGALAQAELRQEANTTATEHWRVELGQLAQSFVQLSQISQGAFSGIARSIGTAISSTNMAYDSVMTLKSGFGSLGSGSTLQGIASIASGIGGIVSVAATAIAAVKALWNWAQGGEQGTIVNPARDTWFNKYGGSVQDVGDKLAEFGIDGETARKMIEKVFQAKTKKDFDAASAAIDNITGLALGGLVKQPTLAMVGESGPELVTPLDKLGHMNLGNMDEVVDRLDRLSRQMARRDRLAPHQMIVAWKDAFANS